MNETAKKLHRMGHLVAQLAWAIFSATFALIFAVWQLGLVGEAISDVCMASVAALGGACAGALAILSALLHERANECEPIEELIFPIEVANRVGAAQSEHQFKDAA